MSLDTKYRPMTYADVLGQDSTKTILRQFVAGGQGFQQSYLFAGAFGSGKTTLGRILARALLCDAPVEGNPCDRCPSCLSLLDGGTVETFCEVDAATNSGKADVKQITDEIQYDTFSGKRRIYLFDESHQLSRDALDALLKPMEENSPGSQDKKLVCIFCTTEPEKMRDTILSRCAPAFVIKPLSPAVIADRLKAICLAEGILHEEDALVAIAAVTECHIRDAIKAVEGVRMLGSVNMANVTQYLDLDINGMYLDVLDRISTDLPGALRVATALGERVSPTTCYQRLAEVAMMAYQVHLGATKPKSFWDLDRVSNLSHLGDVLLGYASRFSNRPGHPTESMLLCDIASLHHLRGLPLQSANSTVLVAAPVQQKVANNPPDTVERKSVGVGIVPVPSNEPSSAQAVGKLNAAPKLLGGGVHVDQRAVRPPESITEGETRRKGSQPDVLEPPLFCRLLGLAMDDSGLAHGRSSGYSNLDRT